VEIAVVLIALAIGLARGLRGRRDRRARSTVARALRGIPTPSDFRPARYPRGRFGR
jgi:hypothetical protein